MAVFGVFLTVSGKRIEVGDVVLEGDLNLKEFESVELVQLDATSDEDAITMTFTPS
ncbi:MAG: hypothetical protein M0Z81_15205 [Deltaproteobacteria bacterium]|jgi:hypothetical protein|nr:hypothetical protein [Deltaproteobacteria bacterium]